MMLGYRRQYAERGKFRAESSEEGESRSPKPSIRKMRGTRKRKGTPANKAFGKGTRTKKKKKYPSNHLLKRVAAK